MRKAIWKRTGALALVGALLAGSVFVSAPPEKVEAASAGKWVLTSENVFIRGEYDSSKSQTGDGSQQISITTSRDDATTQTYKSTCRYDGKSDGKITLFYGGGWYNGSDSFTSDHYAECTVPESSYAAGATVTLKYKLWAENKVGVGIHNSVRGYLDDPSVPWGFSTYSSQGSDNNLKDTSGEYYFLSGQSGGSENWDVQNITVSAKMPSDNSTLDQWALNFSTDAGMYQWIYTYNASDVSDDDDEDASDLSDLEDDIEVDQVKNLKVVNKKVQRIYASYSKVSDATGYEVQYATKSSFSGAKKLTTKSTKGYFVNKKGKKLTFKKGKTYYVRVRAYAKDSSGDKVYGKWSTTQKVKIKK